MLAILAGLSLYLALASLALAAWRVWRTVCMAPPQPGRIYATSPKVGLADLAFGGHAARRRGVRVEPVAGAELPRPLVEGLERYTWGLDSLRDAAPGTPVAVFALWEEGPYVLQDARGRRWLIA